FATILCLGSWQCYQTISFCRMCVHINSLNYDCLIAIFKHLSTEDLLRLELVCRQWAAIQVQLCNLKTALVLLDTDLVGYFQDYGNHFGFLEYQSYRCLKVDFISKKVSHFLVRKFPN